MSNTFHVAKTMDCLDLDKALRELDNKPPVDLIYIDPPFNTGRNFGEYNDAWHTMEDYVAWLTPRLKVCWDAIDNGSLVIHLDWRSVHYVKVAMDLLAGRKNFMNDIVWSYNSGGAGRRVLARKHDTLLWYAKGDYVFNVMREPYATGNVSDRVGFHADGRMLTDVWRIPFISTTGSERCGYPTQKPLGLLDRVVGLFSPVGGFVVDGFCGSGTTGVSAKGLGRSCLLLDVNGSAVDVSLERLGAV